MKQFAKVIMASDGHDVLFYVTQGVVTTLHCITQDEIGHQADMPVSFDTVQAAYRCLAGVNQDTADSVRRSFNSSQTAVRPKSLH